MHVRVFFSPAPREQSPVVISRAGAFLYGAIIYKKNSEQTTRQCWYKQIRRKSLSRLEF